MSERAPDEPAVEAESTERGDASRIPCGELALERRLEALLLSTDRALTDARLVDLLGLPKPRAKKKDAADAPSRQVREAIESLNDGYDESDRAFRIERLAGGWQILTRPEFGPLLARLHRDRQQGRLSPAALETLSIIAYRQPILRAEIEAIRGVACGEVLRGLLERRLVKIVGRAEELGRPMLYGTTREFLTVFGLSGLNDLPEVEGLSRERSHRLKPPPPSTETPSTETPPAELESPPDLDEPEPEEEPAAEIVVAPPSADAPATG